MPFTLHLDGSCLQVTLSGELNIAQAREFADALKPALQPECTLAIDASELSRLDAAILQILLAGTQFAAEATLVAASPAWKTAFSRYASPDPFRIL
ncbi:MAG: STAS domain-containing protein [Nibricoccus sp.]